MLFGPVGAHQGDIAWPNGLSVLLQIGDGDLVVADYKTDDERDPARVLERYGEQLRVYSEATQRALELTRRPRAELWMVRTGECIAVDPNEG